jgi:NAD(P)-dependent dehydrogenase (short-subunit alcohol dehydrogenase family)
MSACPLVPTVLVTGAAKLLGREVALRLAANGWRVAVHYRDSVEDATKTVATCAQSTRGSAAFRTNLGNETAHNFSFAAMEKHMRSNAGAAHV